MFWMYIEKITNDDYLLNLEVCLNESCNGFAILYKLIF